MLNIRLFTTAIIFLQLSACSNEPGRMPRSSISQAPQIQQIHEVSESSPAKDHRAPMKIDRSLPSNKLSAALASNVDLCSGLVSSNQEAAVPLMSKPPVGRAFRDPAFGARVIRVSQTNKGDVVKPQYSTIQAWNADESRLMLYHSGGNKNGHHLYDGKNYNYIKRIDIVAKDIEEVYWHHTDPDILFYVSAYFKYYGQLIRYNIKTEKRKVVGSFDKICGADAVPVSGNDVMMPALNDDLFGFRCNDGQGNEVGYSFMPTTSEIKTVKLGEGTNYQKWYAPMPSASGKYYRLNGSILESDLKTVRFNIDTAEFHSHSSMGRLANGHDALFATAYDIAPKGCDGGRDKGVGSLVVHDFEEKTCRVVVGKSTGYNYPLSGVHVSAVAHHKPGWVAMSSIGYGQFKYHSNNQPAPVLFSEVYLVNTDPNNPQVCRVAHHRSYGKDASSSQYSGYMGEPHATISPSGTRIVFGSDWYDSGSVDAYVVELPAYKR